MNTRKFFASIIAACALVIVGCSSTPEPEVLKGSLQEVTTAPEVEEPNGPGGEDELSVEPLDCSRYLTVTVRGTGEPSRGQMLSPVARAIGEARPNQVQTLDIDYPADTDVKAGGTRAVAILTTLLNQQAEHCEEQSFILLGYSQGSLIIGDSLADPSVRLVGENAGEFSREASERILAVVMYGDPRFLGSETYNVGSFDAGRNGILPRPAGSLRNYEEVVRDYCVARDFICQSSFDLDEQGHVAYYSNGMQQDGAAFVITRMDPPVDLTDEEPDESDSETPDSAERDGDNDSDESSPSGEEDAPNEAV